MTGTERCLRWGARLAGVWGPPLSGAGSQPLQAGPELILHRRRQLQTPGPMGAVRAGAQPGSTHVEEDSGPTGGSSGLSRGPRHTHLLPAAEGGGCRIRKVSGSRPQDLPQRPALGSVALHPAWLHSCAAQRYDRARPGSPGPQPCSGHLGAVSLPWRELGVGEPWALSSTADLWLSIIHTWHTWPASCGWLPSGKTH